MHGNYVAGPDIRGRCLLPVSRFMVHSRKTTDSQLSVLNNITYVLLDAPVFRKRTKADPYPARYVLKHTDMKFGAK